jgi:hypothetical protein
VEKNNSENLHVFLSAHMNNILIKKPDIDPINMALTLSDYLIHGDKSFDNDKNL